MNRHLPGRQAEWWTMKGINCFTKTWRSWEFLVVQWLRLGAFTALTWVLFLVGKLRSHKPHGRGQKNTGKKKKSMKTWRSEWIWWVWHVTQNFWEVSGPWRVSSLVRRAGDETWLPPAGRLQILGTIHKVTTVPSRVAYSAELHFQSHRNTYSTNITYLRTGIFAGRLKEHLSKAWDSIP